MADVGDIIEIPYQEGKCVQCGWIIVRNEGAAWSGQLGGDCRSDRDGVHLATDVTTKTRRARIAERILTTIILFRDGEKVFEFEVPADNSFNWRGTEPLTFTDMSVYSRKIQFNAAVSEDE